MSTVVVSTNKLTTGYGPQAVIHDIDIEVRAGEVVTLLGPNGAGKTTTLLALSGELPLQSGEVLIDGMVTTAPLHKRAKNGLTFVTEERSVFKGLSTRDNLRVGGVTVEAAVALFPELERRLDVRGGLLSGGEQQMLTLARALSRSPRAVSRRTIDGPCAARRQTTPRSSAGGGRHARNRGVARRAARPQGAGLRDAPT